MKQIELNNGVQMPQIGLGVWQAKDGQEVVRAIHWALESGYRHIDTASIYKNEEGVGQAIQTALVDREQIFLTTKIWNNDIRARRTKEALKESLDRLQTSYVDLLLLHWPVDHFEEAWLALEEAYQAGQAKAIGLSNFMPEQIEKVIEIGSVIPAVNQIEYHPYLTQADVTQVCEKHGIVVTAWSPLMQGHFKNESLFADIAAAHGKTPAQVVLRWGIQRDVIIIPKSTNQGRIQENFELFDFELSTEEMQQINDLERGRRFGPDPRNFDF
ncbi:MAG: aldo/keto reductase [Bacteroidota bacterium]